MRQLAAWTIALALAICFVPNTFAQSSGDSPPTTVLLDLGFAGQLPGGQWAPVRVIVSPMDDAVEAVARITIRTPSNDTITTLVPVDTTPSKETVVPTTMWIPPSITSISVELMQRGGGRITSTAYGAIAGAQAIQIDPPPTQMPIILGVGSPSLRMAFGNENYQREFIGPLEEDLRNRVAVAKVAAAVPLRIGEAPWLPTAPAAYLGLAATVIDGRLALSLEPEGVRALRESVIAGGRVVIVNADNQALRAILGQHLPDGLGANPASPTPLPEALGGPGEIAARSFDAQSLPTGWKIVPQTEGLAAQGPVGLGWVMVLGFDPDELADADLVSATEMAWHGTLAVMIQDDLDRGVNALGNRWEDPSLRSAAATNALNWVSRAPAVGLGAFLAIFAMMVGLAIAIGPVDRFVLKRLGSLHRWWLAALAWIILATIGALILPPRVRSGPTSVSSVRVVDAWQSSDGATRAWQSSVDGMFMNTSATIGLDDIDEGSWLSPMVDPWQQAGLGSLTMAPAGRTMKPAPTTARLWTIRTFQQQGATTPPINASVQLDDDRYTLQLTGSIAGSVEVAAVRTSGQWLHVFPGSTPRRTGQSTEFVATRGDLNPHAPRQFNIEYALEHRYEYMYPQYDGGAREPEPSLMLHLDGAGARGPALQALSDTDDWAVVYLKWRNEQPLIGSDVGETFSTMWVCRLAVPIDTPGAPR